MYIFNLESQNKYIGAWEFLQSVVYDMPGQ